MPFQSSYSQSDTIWRSVYRSSPYGAYPFHWYEAGWHHPDKLILLHGVMAHAMAYRYIFDALARHFHVCLVDLPGHGRDQTFKDPSVEPKVDALTPWLYNLIHTMGFKNVHLVGHSFGAMIVYNCIQHREYLDTIKTATLLSPGLYFHRWARVLSPVFKKIPTRVADLFVQPWGMRLFEPIQWRAGHKLSKNDISRYLAPAKKERERFEFVFHIIRDIARCIDRLDTAYHVKTPTLVISGDKDWILPASKANILAERIPEAQAFILKQCGHCPMEDYPEEVTRMLFDFLRPHTLKLSSI